MLIIEDPTVTVKYLHVYRTVLKVLFLSLICLCVKFDSLSCSFTSISFLINYDMFDFYRKQNVQF